MRVGKTVKYIFIAVLILTAGYFAYKYYLSYIEGLSCTRFKDCEQAVACPASNQQYTLTNKPNPSYKSNKPINEKTNYPKLVHCN